MTKEENKKVCDYMQQLWNERCAFKGLFDVTDIERCYINHKHLIEECFDVEVKVVDGKVVIE